jgi:CRP-like cAMP-binding protein
MVDDLLRFPAVQWLPMEVRRRAAEAMSLRQYRDGDLLFDQGRPGDGLYAMIKGAARIVKLAAGGEQTLVDFIAPGHWFGEVAVLDGQPREMRGESCGSSAALFWPAEHFLALRAQSAALEQQTTRLLCAKLRSWSNAAVDATRRTLSQRLAQRLALLAETFPEPQGGHVRIAIALPQEDLASLLGATRQRINQILRDWQIDGIVKVEYRHIVVMRMDALKRLAA